VRASAGRAATVTANSESQKWRSNGSGISTASHRATSGVTAPAPHARIPPGSRRSRIADASRSTTRSAADCTAATKAPAIASARNASSRSPGRAWNSANSAAIIVSDASGARRAGRSQLGEWLLGAAAAAAWASLMDRLYVRVRPFLPATESAPGA
jgi:hypothetical protein